MQDSCGRMMRGPCRRVDRQPHAPTLQAEGRRHTEAARKPLLPALRALQPRQAVLRPARKPQSAAGGGSAGRLAGGHG